MVTNNRPISPHLHIYRLPLTALVSILHRVTGVLLSVGLIFLAYLLYAVAGGEASFLALRLAITSWPAKILYWSLVFALLFHFCHGIRHLIWDAGKSFDPATLNRYAGYELSASLTLSLIVLFLT